MAMRMVAMRMMAMLTSARLAIAVIGVGRTVLASQIHLAWFCSSGRLSLGFLGVFSYESRLTNWMRDSSSHLGFEAYVYMGAKCLEQTVFILEIG